MPILEVDQVREILLKRSMGSGFGGIDARSSTTPRPRRCSATPEQSVGEISAEVHTAIDSFFDHLPCDVG
jgi:NAD/NADP transhydrogenase beta subunit